METETPQQESSSAPKHNETEAEKVKREQKQQDDKLQKSLKLI